MGQITILPVDPLNRLLHRSDVEALALVQSLCIEAALTGTSTREICNRSTVRVWVARMIEKNAVAIISGIVNLGFAPQTDEEYWSIIEHPAIAALFAKECPEVAQLTTRPLRRSNLQDVKYFSGVLKAHRTRQEDARKAEMLKRLPHLRFRQHAFTRPNSSP